MSPKQFPRLLLELSLVLCLLPGFSLAEQPSPPTPSVALLAEDRDARIWMELFLGAVEQVELVLVDRGASDALLKERNVLLQQNRNGENRFDLREWVSADILILAESVMDENDKSGLIWFRALDVVTGVRLADEVLEIHPNHLDRSLKRMQNLLEQNVVPSWRVLWRKGKPFAGVSLLDIRLTGAGEQERHVFSSLDTLLHRLIIQEPSLVLLERNLLGSILQEEAISPALRLNLQSSLVMLEGFVHQETDGPVFTLRGTTPSNKRIFEDVFPITHDLRPIDVASRALERLAESFSETQLRPVQNLARESNRFHRLAEYYHRRNELERALDAAVTAFALHPTERNNTLMLYRCLYEKRMQEIVDLESPIQEELAQKVLQLRELFEYLHTIPMDHSHTRWNARVLLDMVHNRYGDQIQLDPHMRSQWKKLENIHKHSLQSANMQLSYSRTDSFTALGKNLDLLIHYILGSHRPLTTSHFNILFSRAANGHEIIRDPIYSEQITEMIAMVETLPEIYPRNIDGTFMPRGDPVLDDTYLRHLMLAVLTYLSRDADPEWEESLAGHIRTCAWLVAEDPLRFPSNSGFMSHRRFPSPLKVLFNNGFQEVREHIEAEGWFVPELYAFEENRLDLVLERKKDSALRLVSTATSAEQYEALPEEMVFRALGIAVSQHPFLKKLELAKSILSPPEGAQITQPVRRNSEASRRHLEDLRVWRNALIVHSYLPPDDEHAGSALEVYHMTDQEVSRVKTIRFPHDGLSSDRDLLYEKRFYQVMLGGREHLYFSHMHSLYRFDDTLNIVQVVKLTDWGFPDYMVSNLFESSEGIYVALAKPYTDKYIGSDGRSGGGSRRNAAGVFLFADKNLDRIEVIASTDRPEPLNDLDRLAAFDVVSLREDTSGTVLFAIANQEYSQIHWFELDGDKVPNRRSSPGNAENIHAWLLEQGYDENESVFVAMKDVILNRDTVFQVRHRRRRIFPGLRPEAHFDVRRLIPFKSGMIFLGRNEGGSEGLFYLPLEHQPDQPQTIRLFADNPSRPGAMVLWNDHVVVRRFHGDHLLFRNEDIQNFLNASEFFSGFPSETHLQEQAQFQKEIRSRITPFSPKAVKVPPSRPTDTFVEVPGGTFSLYPRGNRQSETVTLTLHGFRMAETKTTYEEFFRVYQWAIHNGYVFSSYLVYHQWIETNLQEPNRPMFGLTSVDALLYCNARSEWEGLKPAYYTDKTHQTVLRSADGNCPWDRRWTEEYVDWNAGYRLPSAAEWEWVARGADPDHSSKFPWGDTVSHAQANYLASDFYTFDQSSRGIHPDYAGHNPPVAPVKAFPPHGYKNRFYGLVGNVNEIVWERRIEFPPDDRRATRRRNPLRPRGGDWASLAEGLTLQASAYGGEAFEKPKGFRLVLPAK